jgi:hypothetical protein
LTEMLPSAPSAGTGAGGARRHWDVSGHTDGQRGSDAKLRPKFLSQLFWSHRACRKPSGGLRRADAASPDRQPAIARLIPCALQVPTRRIGGSSLLWHTRVEGRESPFEFGFGHVAGPPGVQRRRPSRQVRCAKAKGRRPFRASSPALGEPNEKAPAGLGGP